jgi:hypothetical protein
MFVLSYYVYKNLKNIEYFDGNCFYPVSPDISIPVSNAYIEDDDTGIIVFTSNNVSNIDFYNKTQLGNGIIDQLNGFLKDPFDDNAYLDKVNCRISY